MDSCDHCSFGYGERRGHSHRRRQERANSADHECQLELRNGLYAALLALSHAINSCTPRLQVQAPLAWRSLLQSYLSKFW